MRETEPFENIVWGGGGAGKSIAWELARAGRRTAVIELALASPRGHSLTTNIRSPSSGAGSS